MTDRHIAYTVTLSEPVREDDAQRIIDDNAGLLEAVNELMPDGFLPGAPCEHVSKEEP